MIKLLRAGFRRYVHSYIFWFALAMTAGIAVFCGMEARRSYFDDFFVTILLIVIAVLISWLVGREHEEGFRNKVICGHTKGSVYVSELILGVGVSAILYVLFVVIFFGLNSYIVGHAPIGVALRIFLGGLAASACTAVVLVTVGCMISRRVVTGIVSILLILSFVLASETIRSVLDRPEYYEKYDYEYTEVVDEKGNTYFQMSIIEGSLRLEPNPDYIKSPIRDVLNVVCHVFPFTPIRDVDRLTDGWFGYHRQVSSNSVGSSHTLWDHQSDFSVTKEEITSLTVSIIFTSVEMIFIGCAGYFLFRKKELK